MGGKSSDKNKTVDVMDAKEYFKELQKQSEKPGGLLARFIKAGFSLEERMLLMGNKPLKPIK